ncbi:MAG: hypothetical protein O3B84_04845 [Chloroflexi bacterium]|nr:hypothetical protein [Chloroflexota bacterium]
MDLQSLADARFTMLVLRVVHISAGVFWVGSIAFLTLILEPHLRRQGPGALRRTMGPLLPVMGPALLAASLATIASGAAMVLVLGWGQPSLFTDTGWGRTVLFGAGMGLAAFAVGDGLVRIQRRRFETLGALLADRVLQGEGPARGEIQQIERIERVLWRLGRTNFALLVLAVVAMAAARYV